MATRFLLQSTRRLFNQSHQVQQIAKMSSSTGYDPKIGIIGAGGVGEAIGLNLTKGGKQVVAFCDHNPDAGSTLLEQGVARYSTPREVAEQCDVVITALTTPPVVRSCVLGEDGLFAGLKAGGVWIEHSTTDHNQVLELDEIAKANGQKFLEAPITGGLTLLQEGKMTTFVGGDSETYEENKELLDQSFNNVLYMGEMGNATITKIVTNMFAGAHIVLSAEALMIAKKANIDMSAYFDAVRLSAGNSYVWETEMPLVFNQTFDPGFHIDLHCKDLNLGYEIGRKYGVPLTAFGMVEQQYAKAMYKYGGTVGSTSPAKLLQDEMDTSFAHPGYENWTYTTQLIPSEMPGRAPTMAVVHQEDGDKAANTKLLARSTESNR